jgi:protoporphyrinogen oxidase
MGKSYLDYAVDPFISGIYAGDPGRLVTQYALPKLYRLEQDYGSFIRGAIKRRKEPKDALTKRATREVFSVKGGLQELTGAIGDAIGGENFRLGAGGLKVGRLDGKYVAMFVRNGETEHIVADRVVSTAGGHALKEIFGPGNKGISAEKTGQITGASMAGGQNNGLSNISGQEQESQITGTSKDEGQNNGLLNVSGQEPKSQITGASKAGGQDEGLSNISGQEPESQITGTSKAGGQNNGLLNVSGQEQEFQITGASYAGLLNAEELEPFERLQYARVIQVVAAYRQWPGIALNAFGGLIPSKEQRNALGILFTSSIFEGRAPEGGAILSVFMGGMRWPEIFGKTDEEIIALAMKEIRETLRTGTAEPDELEIFRYRYAIPQYEKSTGERLAAVRNIEERNAGLLLAGNIRDGIGMADRVKQGYAVAEQIIQQK